jgi:hypothetical protein
VLELLAALLAEVLLVVPLWLPQPASPRIPAVANRRRTNDQRSDAISGRLFARCFGHRYFVSFSLVFSGSASQLLHTNMISERM